MGVGNKIFGAFGIFLMAFGALLIYLYYTTIKFTLSSPYCTCPPPEIMDSFLWAFFMTVVGIIIFTMAWFGEKYKPK